VYEVLGTIAAGAAEQGGWGAAGGVARIATGAAVPQAFDAVIAVEQSSVSVVDGAERVRFEVEEVVAGRNIHRRATDATAGEVLIEAGRRLSVAQVGIACAVGATELTVTRLPRVTVLTTGDEVCEPGTATEDLQPQQIRNSNGAMLKAFLEALGVPVVRHVHVADEPEMTVTAAREALGESNLVVTVGGVSVGQRDFLPEAWRTLGLREVVHGVAIQPGKPVLVAQVEGEVEKLVIGLPGNPVSVLVTAHLFVWPVLRKMLGLGAGLPWRKLRLSEAVKPSERRQMFRAGELVGDGHEEVRVLAWHGSGDLVHTAKAQGLVRLPMQGQVMEAGMAVGFLPLVGEV
jgi:molybdopterin molybdotransferase